MSSGMRTAQPRRCCRLGRTPASRTGPDRLGAPGSGAAQQGPEAAVAVGMGCRGLQARKQALTDMQVGHQISRHSQCTAAESLSSSLMASMTSLMPVLRRLWPCALSSLSC